MSWSCSGGFEWLSDRIDRCSEEFRELFGSHGGQTLETAKAGSQSIRSCPSVRRQVSPGFGDQSGNTRCSSRFPVAGAVCVRVATGNRAQFRMALRVREEMTSDFGGSATGPDPPSPPGASAITRSRTCRDLARVACIKSAWGRWRRFVEHPLAFNERGRCPSATAHPPVSRNGSKHLVLGFCLKPSSTAGATEGSRKNSPLDRLILPFPRPKEA